MLAHKALASVRRWVVVRGLQLAFCDSVAAVVAGPWTDGERPQWIESPLEEAQPAMSQRTVERVIGRLVTDEELRFEFTRAPRETLANLAELGWELTAVEIDALLRTDLRLWSDAAARVDPRLQCSSLKSGEDRGERA